MIKGDELESMGEKEKNNFEICSDIHKKIYILYFHKECAKYDGYLEIGEMYLDFPYCLL